MPTTANAPWGALVTLPTSAHQLRASPAPMHRRRLLVITYHFPPDGAVGGLRWAGLSKYLARLGWEVHLVTAARAGGEAPVPGVHRHACAPRRTLNDAYRALMSNIRRSRPNGPPATNEAPPVGPRSPRPRRLQIVRALPGYLRTAGGLALDFPDEGRGWVVRAATTARALLAAQPFDAVITSGPPHSAHFAGLLATAGRRVPHVIDMRDPWSMMSREWPGYAIKSRLFRWLEAVLFHHTRHVVVNTGAFAEALQQERPRLSVSTVTNGTDLESLPPRATELREGIGIAYAGTVYIGRSFTALLQALEDVSQAEPQRAAALRLRIAGQMGAPQVAQLQEDVARRGLGGMVELLGPLPRATALELVRRSHLALVLAQAQPTQVPAKLYESVGLGVPTLVIAESTSAAGREARRIGAMTVGPDDRAGLRRVVEDLVHGRVPVTVTPRAPIAYEFLARQMERVILQACAGRGD